MSEELLNFDHNATTPVDPEVLEGMLPWLREGYGNPSSPSAAGRLAKDAIEEARAHVAGLIGAKAPEIVFTSGGTESNNHALIGLARMTGLRGRHGIISAIEHPAVNEVCRFLEETAGWEFSVIPVDSDGIVKLGEFESLLRVDTAFVSVMHSNNEIGTIQPIVEIAKIVQPRGILFHTDAAQSLGKVAINIGELGVDLLSMAGHKFYAPKGTGALFIREGLKLPKFMHGAGQEHGLRAGTENVPGWVGFGRAAEIARRDLDKNTRVMSETRNQLHELLLRALPGCVLNGHAETRLPNTLNLTFPGVSGSDIVSCVADRVAISSGAACHSGKGHVSAVLSAIGAEEAARCGSVRFSTGKHTTKDQVRKAAAEVVDAVSSLKNR